MIRLATLDDVPRLNEIGNHPEVLPYIGDGQDADFAKCPPSVLTFISEFGLILFMPVGDNWEFHTMFLPEGRGRHALQVAKACANKMFDQFGALALVTYTPDDCPHARPPRTFGFEKTGREEEYIRGVGADEWTLTEKKWRSKQCQPYQ